MGVLLNGEKLTKVYGDRPVDGAESSEYYFHGSDYGIVKRGKGLWLIGVAAIVALAATTPYIYALTAGSG